MIFKESLIKSKRMLRFIQRPLKESVEGKSALLLFYDARSESFGFI